MNPGHTPGPTRIRAMNEPHGRRLLQVRPLLRWALAALAAFIALPSLADVQHPDRIVIGRITDNPRTDYVRLKGLLDRVIPKLAEQGIRDGAVLLARDPQQMAGYLRRGRVDWVTETPAMAAELENRSGAQPFLRALREDRNVYRSLVFVRRDSGIQTLADLRGKRLALQTRSSTSAFYLPLITLLGAGLPLTELGTPDDRPAADEVGFLLARSELNIATWVHKGLADAGAFSNLDWDNPRRMPPSFRADFRVIAESDSVPRAIELVRADLPNTVADALRDVLLAIDQDPAAGDALRGYFATARFEAIDAETRRALTALNARILPLRRELER